MKSSFKYPLSFLAFLFFLLSGSNQSFAFSRLASTINASSVTSAADDHHISEEVETGTINAFFIRPLLDDEIQHYGEDIPFFENKEDDKVENDNFVTSLFFDQAPDYFLSFHAVGSPFDGHFSFYHSSSRYLVFRVFRI